MIPKVTNQEIIHAQLALLVAAGLQFAVLKLSGDDSLVGPQFIIIAAEVVLAVLLGMTANSTRARQSGVHKFFATGLLGLLTAANISSLYLVLQALIVTHVAFTGTELLVSALAIFLTNIIVFALWYWEIDSPGLSGTRWSKHDKDFQFTQQNMKVDFPKWRPTFLDYLYLSVTNAINFAPADTKPLTHAAKFLMGTQAIVSIFTLALVIARSVNIIGQ